MADVKFKMMKATNQIWGLNHFIEVGDIHIAVIKPFFALVLMFLGPVLYTPVTTPRPEDAWTRDLPECKDLEPETRQVGYIYIQNQKPDKQDIQNQKPDRQDIYIEPETRQVGYIEPETRQVGYIKPETRQIGY